MPPAITAELAATRKGEKICAATANALLRWRCGENPVCTIDIASRRLHATPGHGHCSHACDR